MTDRQATTGTLGGNRYKVIRKRVSSLRPSPENEVLYRSMVDDPGIDALAESIRKNGLFEPLVITADNHLVSGHRRHTALLRIGQRFATCRVLNVNRASMTTDEFIALMREHNRQRNKTIAEQVREELIDVDATQAHRHLCELRDKSLYTAERSAVEILEIEGHKRRHGISDQKAEHVSHILKVVEERRAYWPLSCRGAHYALLNYDFVRGRVWVKDTWVDLRYKNDDRSYSATCDLVTRLRLNGELPWAAFDDSTRPIQEFHAFTDVRSFVRQEVNNLFGGYWRDLLQTQPAHIECICEKNAIFHMILRVTQKYQIPTSSARGFNSIDPLHDLRQRYVKSGKQRLIVLILSDLDPEGEQILQSSGRTLRDDFGIWPVDIIKAGITKGQIERYHLPPMNFAKESSSNLAWFLERNGGDATTYELEALDPKNMLDDLDETIRCVVDLDLFNREVARERDEAAYLDAARKTAASALKDLAD
jgi:hypothetical protein